MHLVARICVKDYVIWQTIVFNFVKLCVSKLTCVLYTAVYMATKTNTKHTVLLVSEKHEIILKVDAQPHEMHTKAV
jgi:hypothetical protein